MTFEISDEMKRKYIQRRESELAQCLIALENRDFNFLERVGHGLRGNACSFGFQDLGIIGEKLEMSALNKNSEASLSAIEEYARFLAELPVLPG